MILYFLIVCFDVTTILCSQQNRQSTTAKKPIAQFFFRIWRNFLEGRPKPPPLSSFFPHTHTHTWSDSSFLVGVKSFRLPEDPHTHIYTYRGYIRSGRSFPNLLYSTASPGQDTLAFGALAGFSVYHFFFLLCANKSTISIFESASLLWSSCVLGDIGVRIVCSTFVYYKWLGESGEKKKL